MILPKVNKIVPMLSQDADSVDSNTAITASVQLRARNADELGATFKGVDDRNDCLRRENTVLRAMLAKMQEELTGVQKREKRARHLAFHDDLTALPNRRFFRERLGRALRNRGSGPPDVAIIYLDLDGFKALNDAYGHATGDALLNLVATRLAHSLRAEDLVSRLGGDEYACLIAGVSSRDRLQHIVLTLFDAVTAPFKIGPLAFNVRPSIGVSMCPSDGTTVDSLMQAADAAMYEAKRNRSSFSFSRRPHAQNTRDLETH
jgi:diguanylate cyclase